MDSEKQASSPASLVAETTCDGTKNIEAASMSNSNSNSNVAASKMSDNTVPSYDASMNSAEFIEAKKMLADGEFEKALELIECAIAKNQTALIAMGEEPDLHACMAPLHYLYGTTLLYSIEESNDTSMTVGQDASAADSNTQAAVDNVEDIEIAWENLDTARSITENMLLDQSIPQQTRSNYELELAQILLREGDLQRINGRYADAITDYEACLNLRKKLIPTAYSKVADVQYNLGLCYLSQSSELLKDANSDNQKQTSGRLLCDKGVDLYIQCARTLLTQLSQLCHLQPTFYEKDAPGLKTTGLDLDDQDEKPPLSEHSLNLRRWRNNAAAHTPHPSDKDAYDNLCQMLEEIQETVDEAERSQEAVREAAQLKEQAANPPDVSDGAAATTTIGFGGSAQFKEATAQIANSNLVVRKRKKANNSSNAPLHDGTSKRSKTD